ncbi:MAG: bifunctional phosphopantothenoylcysteine decarboxylase/phosphopantothenate--cysteine ligase CoaBC [Bacteroidota bacterium]
MSILQGKKIILGLTGSIAAYKSVFLLRLLQKAGAEVRVCTTPSVSEFVGELTLSGLTGEKVFSGIWEENWSEHVEWGNWADLFIVAPLTANTLAKMAHGLCDNALTAVYLAARCPVMVAPAMDVDMYRHPRTQANIKILSQDGVQVLPTGSGYLASGLQGPGRMMEPEEILTQVEQFFGPQPLQGKKVLISAGPTREAIDPVRFISNRSTGKMGYALAEEAQALGAEVVLVSGPTSLAPPAGVNLLAVESAQQMFEAVVGEQPTDIVIMAAAVADYTPAEVADEKIKKKEGDMAIPLQRTQDILRYLGGKKPAGQILVGFAMETQHELENAQKKLEAKNLDFVVLNSLREKGAGFGHNTNKITLLSKQHPPQTFDLKSKREVAKDIFSGILTLI